MLNEDILVGYTHNFAFAYMLEEDISLLVICVMSIRVVYNEDIVRLSAMNISWLYSTNSNLGHEPITPKEYYDSRRKATNPWAHLAFP